MSSSRLSPSIFEKILPSIVATAVALDAFTPAPPPNFVFSNNDDLAAMMLLARGADDGDKDCYDRTENRRGREKGARSVLSISTLVSLTSIDIFRDLPLYSMTISLEGILGLHADILS